MATSAVLHVGAIAALLFLARNAAPVELPRASRALTFVRVLTAPDPALVEPIEPLHLPTAIREEPTVAETEPPKIDTPPVPERPVSTVAHVEPTPPAPEPRREKPVEPPRPAPPVVTVGAFAPNTAAAHTFEPVSSVQSAGFDAPAARAPEIKIASPAVGAFDQPAAAARPQPGSDRPNVVTDAGFGTAMTPSTSQPAARVVADAGFGGRSGPAGAHPQPPPVVRTTEFDARPAPAAPAPRAPRIETPLEILSKPTPAYTDEARALKIEGEVLLDVNFSATGEVHVLRVVRGLGHGLDESATRAAQGMRFKAARSAGGRPVDFRTTVHIVFRLA